MAFKELRATTREAAALKHLADRRGMSKSAVVADIITRYASGELGFEPTMLETPFVKIRYTEPEAYAAALDKAHQAQLALSDVIRQTLLWEVADRG